MEITLKLAPQEVQLLINALAALPYGQVRGVIEKVVEQANAKPAQEGPKE
jgi:hypothetical protein